MFSQIGAGLAQLRGTSAAESEPIPIEEQVPREQATTVSGIYQKCRAVREYVAGRDAVEGFRATGQIIGEKFQAACDYVEERPIEALTKTALVVGVACTPLGAVLTPLGFTPVGPVFLSLGGAGLTVYKTLSGFADA